ncbi:MAG TPA: universal stress protein [Candidatus Binataceae bacterium]
MALFKTILVPTDFDPNSMVAIDLARQLAVQNGSTIHLYNVIAMPQEPPSGVVTPYKELQSAALEKLQRLAKSRLGSQVKYQVHVRVGNPEPDLVRAADKLGADLIVIATHGRGGLKRFLLGSFAEHVVRAANCPVLVVKPNVRKAAARKTAKLSPSPAPPPSPSTAPRRAK